MSEAIKVVSSERRIRTFMLLLSGVALVTTVSELWLEDHTKETLQWIPWVLCAGGLAALVPPLLRPTRSSLLALRVVMAVVALGGLVGIGVHLAVNLDFQQQIHPGATAGSFIMAALKGAAPLLAPGALLFAALLGIAATYSYPASE